MKPTKSWPKPRPFLGLRSEFLQMPVGCPLLYKDWYHRGWSGGAMVLGKLPVPGRPTIWIQ